ncbi:amidohydrolase family protein [Yunchengibacter salinarum]|uniref:amidohydrolase family protein n=1 Tax=Yunchengibacter salinarum TaxID=3133399 RepID=UPI0035B5AB28
MSMKQQANRLLARLGAATLALGLVAGAASADRIAVVGGTAYTKGGSGKVENATILVNDGIIESVESGGDVPPGYSTVDADGKWVTVGLMAPMTTLGMGEVSLSAGINDARVKKAESPLALDATHAINPDSTLIKVTRMEGVTRAVTGFAGTGSMWQGQGSVITLGDGPDLVVRPRAYVGLDISEGAASAEGGSRAALWQKLIHKLTTARKARRKKSGDDATEKADGCQKCQKMGEKMGKKGGKPGKKKGKKGGNGLKAEKEALDRLLAGEVPLVVTAHRASDIRQALALKSRFGLKVILKDAEEGWRVADDIAAAGVPVILDSMANLPSSFETLGATQQNAARLHRAGVTIAFLSGGVGGSHNTRLLPQFAGNAVAHGLPWEAAMDAMTVNVAEMFGVADSYGTLEPGKVADIVVWNGDPMEVMTSPDAVMIAGRNLPLESRQTKLRDRYLEIDRSPAYDH